MRLRHKKPINAYTGQANHDSSSAHDQDFDKNQTQSRRPKLVKPKPVTEQTKKYAEILLEFTAVVNQNFRNHVKKNSGIASSQTHKDKIEPNLLLSAKQNIFMEDHGHGKTEVVSKQQQKIRKLESLPQKFPPQTKKIRKERTVVEEQPKKKEVPAPPIQRSTLQPPQPAQPAHTAQFPNLIDLTAGEKPQQNSSLPPKSPNLQNIQNMFQNPYMMMNPALFNPMLLQMAMMSQPNLQEMKNDPNMMSYLAQMQNMFGMIPVTMQTLQNMQNSQGGKNNFIPFNQLPFLNNEGKQALNRQLKKFQEAQQEALKKAQQIQNQSNSQRVLNNQQNKRTQPPSNPHFIPQQPPKPQIPKVKKNQPELTPNKKIPSFPQIPISNKKQSQLPKNEGPNSNNNQEMSKAHPMLPNFNRRASNHVSIAYNIHFHHLRQKGMINNNLSQMKSPDDLKIIDPTYPARKIRERKNSDHATGIHKPCEITPS